MVWSQFGLIESIEVICLVEQIELDEAGGQVIKCDLIERAELVERKKLTDLCEHVEPVEPSYGVELNKLTGVIGPSEQTDELNQMINLNSLDSCT